MPIGFLELVSKVLVYLVIGFFLGIFISSILYPYFSLVWFQLILISGLLIFGKIFSLNKHLYSIMLFICLVLLGSSFGILRYRLAENKTSPNLSIGSQVNLIGKIVAEPDEREAKTQLIFVDEATDNKILVFTDRFPRYSYGDKLKIQGKIVSPQNFTTKAGTVFDYKNYLAVRGIKYQIFQPKITLIEKANWSLVGGLIGLKNLFNKSLVKTISEPQNALMGGLLLGDKSGLGKEITDSFQTAGLSHLVVLSGYNITIVASSVMLILSFLPRTIAFGGGVLGIILFTLAVGGGSSATRAAVMAILSIWASGYGRLYQAGRALIVVAFLMVLWNPKIFVFDLGFQLSFLATVGIVYLTPVIKGKTKWLPEKFGLQELVSTTLAAQIMVYPWLVYKMGNLSLIGIIANIFVLPIVPITMFFGFLTGVLGIFSYFISLPFAYLSYFFLSYILFMAKFFSAFPLASIQISSLPWCLVVVIYVFIGFLILKNERVQAEA